LSIVLADGERWRVIEGDALAVLRTLPDSSFDAVVTDPPAGIGFMGKEWDDFRRARNPADVGRDSPFGRTSAKGPEYGRRPRDGFVTFLTTAMAECLRVARPGAVALVWAIPRTSHWTATALEDAGWLIEDRIAHLFGQGFPKHKSKLKPACEDWWLCRKPGPKWLGVEAARIPVPGGLTSGSKRWPANVALSHSPDCNGGCAPDCPARLLDEQVIGNGLRCSRGDSAGMQRTTSLSWFGSRVTDCDKSIGYGDGNPGASRFFYCAKASRADRGPDNMHPTVKSTALMRWLCRLACPPGGLILDPFAGSGSTLKAALLEGCRAVGIEQSPDYCKIARRRLGDPEALPPAGGLFAGLA
jgi:DNA modification methylase